MNNNDLINKLVQGTEPTTITIEYEGEDYPFRIRPLTDGELCKLQEIENKPLNVSVNVTSDVKNAKNNATINNAELLKAQHKVKVQAVCWGLSIKGEPNVKLDNVENLPIGLSDQLFNEIINLSKISDDDLKLVKRFR